MNHRYAILAALALACSGEKATDSGDSAGTTNPECPNGVFTGPTTITHVEVTCTGNQVRLAADTEGWTHNGSVYSQETANIEPQWNDEHSIESYEYDACGYEDHLERVLNDGSTLADPLNDWSIDSSSLFRCDDHYTEPVMTYAFMVY